MSDVGISTLCPEYMADGRTDLDPGPSDPKAQFFQPQQKELWRRAHREHGFAFLSRAGKAAWASSPVGERGDDQPWRVTQVLVRVLDLGVADVGEAVPLLFIPAMPELGLPGEGLRALHLRGARWKQLVSRPIPDPGGSGPPPVQG